jgi:hypothetical protein
MMRAIVREADQDRRRQGEEIKSARLKSEEATSRLEEDVRRLKRHMDQLQMEGVCANSASLRQGVREK